ncbi:MAG: LUD domain-containing protein [Acidimicrobiales bacterium]|nr:LUD domain-containing protein [Acidimicrobiales bacterium]
MSEPTTEVGDRAGFLARIRERQGPPPRSGPHPAPDPPEVVPEVRYRSLDDVAGPGLVDVFATAARAAEATVDVVAPDGIDEPLRAVVETHEVHTAVVSNDPGLDRVAGVLAGLGVAVSPYDRETAATADLAVTGATHGLASTGSVVVDTEVAGSRAVSLLPRVHLCVLPAERIVPTHADVLRHQSRPMPSCRVVITGPSRTGDIEQRLTLGAHGPVALHLLVTT